jgi:D-alanyl-D-alanine carboxypeptidase
VAFVAALLYLWDRDSRADNHDDSSAATGQATGLTISSPPSGELPTQPSTSDPRDDAQVDSEKRAVVPDLLLVNAANPLPSDYYPENLVNLYEQEGKHFQLAKYDIEVCETVFEAMGALFAAAQQDGVDGFIITSGYRTRDEQRELFNSTTDGTAARPGESEHETGLAFDVDARGDEHFELTPQYAWLFDHCAEYGFIIRYPQGAESVTGIPYEPWHFRYVGKEHAEIIMGEGITLEQYCEEYR